MTPKSSKDFGPISLQEIDARETALGEPAA